MTEPIGKKDPFLRVQGSALNVNMKVNHLEQVKKTSGIAQFVFDVSFRSKEAPGKESSSLAANHKLYVHAEHLEKALQILHVIGDKFKQMNSGELQHHLQKDFEQINVRREHQGKKTVFHTASEDKTTGQMRHDEMVLTKQELDDLKKYAGYLESEQAIKDGIADVKGITPEIELERADTVRAKVSAEKIPEGTVLDISFDTPIVWKDLAHDEAKKKLDAMIGAFPKDVKTHLNGWLGLLPDSSQSKRAIERRKNSENLLELLKAAIKEEVDKESEAKAALEAYFDTAFNEKSKREEVTQALEAIIGTLYERLLESEEGS